MEINAIGSHDLEARIADLFQAVADAAILNGAGQSRILSLVKGIFDCLQTLTQSHPLT